MGARSFLPLLGVAAVGCAGPPSTGLADADGVAKFVGPTVSVCADGSGDQTTIQAAIDAAPSGSTLSVCAGTYAENLRVAGKALRVVSEDGAAATIIDGGGSGAVLTVAMSSGAGLQVDGFTLQNGSGTGAGGVQCTRSTFSLSDSIVRDNTGAEGAGLMAWLCSVSLSSSDFEDNVAVGRGGGAYLSSSSGSVDGCTFDGNEAEEGGGLALASSPVDVTGNTLTDNEATTTSETLNGPGSGGGGLWVYGDATIRGNTIQSNDSGYHGGGLYVWGGSAEIADNDISDNYSGEDGGGGYTNQSSAWLHDNIISGNEAFDDAGGFRIYVGGMTVEDNLFESNIAGDDGGGLKLSHSDQTVRRNAFADNTAGDAGGGLELDNETTTIEDCTFEGNSATRGGGLHSWRNEDVLTIVGALFTDNTASDCGGGVQFDNDPYEITIEQSVFEGNTASDGGGLCVDEVELEDGGFDDTVFALVNTAFYNNVATDDGGAVYLKTAIGTVRNTVLFENSAPTASGLVLKSGTVTLMNSIVYRNTGSDGVVVEGGTLTPRFNDVFGHWGHSNWSGLSDPTGTAGNISQAPAFDWPRGGDFHLDPSSPCIDAGLPFLTDPDGTRSDMGAHGGPEGAW